MATQKRIDPALLADTILNKTAPRRAPFCLLKRDRLNRHRIRRFLELRDLVKVHVAINLAGLGNQPLQNFASY